MDNRIDVLFLLAGHDPASKKLESALKEAAKSCESRKSEQSLQFCVASFMGFGLYKRNVVSLKEFEELYKKMIYTSE